jgi:tripartite-type tricarboxylate transporter receptor subunit TctC
MLVPVRTPIEITARISREVIAVLKRPDVIDVLSRQGYSPVASTAAELAAQIKADLAKWSKVIKDAGITAD